MSARSVWAANYGPERSRNQGLLVSPVAGWPLGAPGALLLRQRWM